MIEVLLLWTLVMVLVSVNVLATSYVWNPDFVDWKNRANITISNNYSITMVNVPIRINVKQVLNNLTNGDYNSFAPNGSDIRFTDIEGVNISSFVEIWNENLQPTNLSNLSIVWINISISNASNKSVLMYYNNNNSIARYDLNVSMFQYENFTRINDILPDGWNDQNSNNVCSYSDIVVTPLTEPYSACFASSGSGSPVILNPISPRPSGNYTIEFYSYFPSPDRVNDDDRYFEDISKSANSVIQWQANFYPSFTTCINSSGDTFSISQTERWIRIQMYRDNTTGGNTTFIRAYDNEKFVGQCNTSNFNYRTIGGKDFRFRISPNPSKTQQEVRIDNWKVYRHSGWNTSDVTLYSKIQTKNIAPNSSNVSLTPTPTSSGNTLRGHALFNDSDGDVTTGNFTLWWANKTIINEANNSFILLGGNVSEGTNITFSARFNDTLDSGSFVNSTTVNIGDSTPPILNNCNISSLSITNSAGNTINFTCQATDASSNVQTMVATINGTLNKTISFSFSVSSTITATYTIFQSFETLNVGGYSIMQVNVTDSSGNSLSNSTNFHWVVIDTPSGNGGSSSGGGGGGSQSVIVINQTNITQTNCNFNQICEATNGEDPFSCPTDCKINTNYLFCDDPTQKCIKDLFDPANVTFRLGIVIVLISLIVIFAPELGIGKVFKKRSQG